MEPKETKTKTNMNMKMQRGDESMEEEYDVCLRIDGIPAWFPFCRFVLCCVVPASRLPFACPEPSVLLPCDFLRSESCSTDWSSRVSFPHGGIDSRGI